MAITILAPAPAEPTVDQVLDSDFDDSDSDVDMEDSGRPAKRSKTSRHLVTPGELVTDDSQWMR
jgi:exosome complex component RRP4